MSGQPRTLQTLALRETVWLLHNPINHYKDLHNLHTSPTFTVEEEKEATLAFLEECICQGLIVTLMREPVRSALLNFVPRKRSVDALFIMQEHQKQTMAMFTKLQPAALEARVAMGPGPRDRAKPAVTILVHQLVDNLLLNQRAIGAMRRKVEEDKETMWWTKRKC